MIDKKDIKIYLTSTFAGLPQSNFSQSIGGYISSSFLYKESELSSNVSLYGETDITLNSINLDGSDYVSINREVIKPSSVSGTNIEIERRGYRTPNFFNLAGNRVFGVHKNLLSNNIFASGKKQYRCVAIKNESTTDTLDDVRVFVKRSPVFDSSDISIAIEQPLASYYSGTVSSGSNISFVDSNLVGEFSDNHFKNCIFKTTVSGTDYSETINTFDSSTGTIVFFSSLPISLGSGVNFEIEPSPAQRLRKANDVPSSSNLISGFSKELRELNFNGRREDNNLSPNDIFYIWIERTLNRGKDGVLDNLGFISVRYRREA